MSQKAFEKSESESINAHKVKTDPDIEELIGWQVKSFAVSVCFGNVVEMIMSVIGDFYKRMPLLCTDSGLRQLPFDPDRQLGALLVSQRDARHADQ